MSQTLQPPPHHVIVHGGEPGPGRAGLPEIRETSESKPTRSLAKPEPDATRRAARVRPWGRLLRLPAAELKTADGHDRDIRHATWLELFFDLVFVAAIAQLTKALQDQPTAAGVVRFAGLFVVIWWVWVMFSTYADRFGTEDAFNRGAMLVAMLLGVGFAASVPAAFQGHVVPFAIAYVLFKTEQVILLERARRQAPAIRQFYGCMAAAGLFSVGCWLTSLAFPGWPRYALWAVAISAEMATPWLTIAAARRAPLNIWHLPERFELFALIVLGESVARLVGAAAHRAWSVPLCVVLAAAFAIIVAMWWLLFNAIDHAMVRRGRRATLAYIYTQLPIVAGIAAAAGGLHHAILAAAGGGAIQLAPRVAIYGGASLYLLGVAALPATRAPRRARGVRLAAAGAALGLVFMGAFVAPVYLVPALMLVLAVEILFDAPRRASRPVLATRRSRAGVAVATMRVPTGS